MNIWHRFHRLPAWLRMPLKVALFVVILALTLFPHPQWIPVLVERVRNLNALLDPACPALAPLESEVRAAMKPGANGQETLHVVEDVVYRHVPYAHDWETWGNAEYLPTVSEVFEKGREDCDGRAIVSGSLLRRLGFQADLATDMLHMWVITPAGEAMHPTSVTKTMVGGPGGTEFRPSFDALFNLFRGFAYGTAAFPLEREMILFAAIFLLTIHPRQSGWQRLAGALALLLALETLRSSGRAMAYDDSATTIARCVFGSLLLPLGWLTLAVRSRTLPGSKSAPASVAQVAATQP